MKNLFTTLAPACLAALLTAPAALSSTGMAAIGFAAFSTADVDQSVNVFKACLPTRACEMAFLTRSFGNFENAERFVKAVLPAYTSGQLLVITMYLDDGANRDGDSSRCWFRPDLSTSKFWSLVGSNNKTLQSDWQTKLAQPAADFVTGMNAWVQSKGYASRIRFVVVPVLEDGIASPKVVDAAGRDYQKILDWTRPKFPAYVQFRRNTVAFSAPRITGLPMEFHKADINGMVAGDMLTADGVKKNGAFIGDDDWIAVQRQAIPRSISALFWWQSFNGDRSKGAPWQRGILKPFTSSPGSVERAKRLITAR